MLSLYYKWSERKKLVMLGNYLEDDVLNCFIENNDNCSFDEMKDKLINRFGVQILIVEPIVEFFNLKYTYDLNIGIKVYFEKNVDLVS
jgi:hypothetical protein